MKLLSIMLIMFTFELKATELKMKDYEQGLITVTFVGVSIGDLGAMVLKATNWTEMEMLCSSAPLNPDKKSYLHYVNYFNIPTGKFVIKDSVCIKLRELLISTLSGINSDYPIVFILNKKTKRVEKIIYPDLDPYLYYIDPRLLKLYDSSLH